MNWKQIKEGECDEKKTCAVKIVVNKILEKSIFVAKLDSRLGF